MTVSDQDAYRKTIDSNTIKVMIVEEPEGFHLRFVGRLFDTSDRKTYPTFDAAQAKAEIELRLIEATGGVAIRGWRASGPT